MLSVLDPVSLRTEQEKYGADHNVEANGPGDLPNN